MNDYYVFVSFFTAVQWKPGVEPREKRIYWKETNRVANPVDGKPRDAKTLGAAEPVGAEGDPRPTLAAWLTASDSEIFPKNLANRIWTQFLGRGLVEPVDDMRDSNPPTNAPLQDALSKRLVELKFELRAFFVRGICTSRVYQLSVQPTPSNAGDAPQFSRARLRRLRADVLLDSVVAVTGVRRNLPNWPAGTKAVEYYPRTSGDTGGPHIGDPFFATFGRSTRGTICACETKSNLTLSQAMHLVGGDTVRDRLTSGGAVKSLIETKSTPEETVTGLFIRTLSRRPTPEALAGFVEMAAGAPKDQAVYEDIFWSLLNSTEFVFNH